MRNKILDVALVGNKTHLNLEKTSVPEDEQSQRREVKTKTRDVRKLLPRVKRKWVKHNLIQRHEDYERQLSKGKGIRQREATVENTKGTKNTKSDKNKNRKTNLKTQYHKKPAQHHH